MVWIIRKPVGTRRRLDVAPNWRVLSARQVLPVISTLSGPIFRSALFGILLCRRGKMPQKIRERIWNNFFQDITIVVTEAIADVR